MTFALNVVRGQSTPEGTPGKGSSNAAVPFTYDTLELPWMNNQADISCILPDTYNAKLFMSPHFGHYVILLENKHGRQNVENHNANFAGEAAGDVKQLDGCTAVGQGYGQLKNNLGHVQYAILNSVATLSNLVEHIINNVGEGGAFTVTYSWGDGCAPADLRDLNPASDTYAGA